MPSSRKSSVSVDGLVKLPPIRKRSTPASTPVVGTPSLVDTKDGVSSTSSTPTVGTPTVGGHSRLPSIRASGRREAPPGTASRRFKQAAFRVWATVAAEQRPAEVTGNNGDAFAEQPISPPSPKKRRSFMKTTPWKTRLPPLPSIVGMHVFRRLYMAQIMALKAPVTSPYQVSEVTISDDGSDSDDDDDERDAETLPPPEVPRVCAELSPEGQYAMLRAYQDRLLEKLQCLVPDLSLQLRVLQTPGPMLPRIHTGSRKWRERRTERSVQDALNLLDSLEEDGSSHLADIRKPRLKPTYNPVRDYRKWCRGWQREFHAHLERERTRIQGSGKQFQSRGDQGVCYPFC